MERKEDVAVVEPLKNNTMFSKEKILELLKNYKLWIIFAMILFIIYLIFGDLAIHTETDIQFDQVVDTLTN